MRLFSPSVFVFSAVMAIVITIVEHAPIDASEGDHDWVISRRSLVEPENVRFAYPIKRYRLICEVQEAEVTQGENIRLFVGVECLSDNGDELLNPFSEESFPANMAISIFDELGNFVQSGPATSNDCPERDDLKGCPMMEGEMRGRFIEISTSIPESDSGSPSAQMAIGTYKLQLVVNQRLFMGRFFSRLRGRAEFERYRADACREAARSNIATLRIVNNRPLPVSIATPEQKTDVKLLAMLGLKARLVPHPHLDASKYQYVMTLRNLSRTESLGFIDPFNRKPACYVRPIRWNLCKNCEWNYDDGGPGPLQSWMLFRSQFLILPPNSVASYRFGGVPTEHADYETRVELLPGVVVDQKEIEILRSGNMHLAFSLGGASPDVLHSDSALSLKFFIDHEKEPIIHR